jgi:uncharacterized protein
MNRLSKKRWSPYPVGIFIGLLSVFAFATAGRGLGITTPFENTAGLAGRAIAPESSALQRWFESRADAPPKLDWELMLVIGVFFGAVLSSKLSGDRGHPAVPALWSQRFGASKVKRLLAAFAGGAVMMVGARLAGGCTSGHGITGTLQLAVSSWVFISLAVIVAAITAFSLFGARQA